MSYFRWIWNFWKPHRAWLWILSILTLLTSFVLLSFPYLLGLMIDVGYKVVGNVAGSGRSYPPHMAAFIEYVNNWIGMPDPGNIDATSSKVIGLVLVVGLLRSLGRIYPRVRMLINGLLGMDIREYYFSKIINKGYRFFTKFRTGDLVTRLMDDVDIGNKIAWFSCSGIFRAIESLSQFIFCLTFMLLLNWKLSLISISPFPILLYIFYKLRSRLTVVSLERQKLISSTNDALEAAYSGVRILKAFNVQERHGDEFRRTLDNRIKTEYRYQELDYRLKFLFQAINKVGQIIVFAAGSYMVLKDELTPGELYAFWVYLDLLLPPLTDIPYLFVASRTAFASIDRENEIEDTPGGTEDVFSGTEEVPRIDDVALDNACFRYSDEMPLVDKDINLSLRRGEKAAVVGAVGSGKSTLIKLVSGLYPPTSGSVRVNSKDISRYNIKDYRARIGYIPQEATLFSESVRDNVRFGREVKDEDILAALDLAQVRDEIEAFPEGLDTVLGQKGLTVSGGQKQRIAIARALADNPDLLLMDDCTSALDAENERRFWEMFSSRYPDTACLIVTHRLSTARQADIIYVMANGEIVGKGSHDELLDSCEEYRNFLTRDELLQALNNRKKSL